MSIGNIMLYGGIIGIIVCLVMLISCLIVFPKQREKLLSKLSNE